MPKILLTIGGVGQVILGIFHLGLGWRIHHWSELPVDARALMAMLNVAGILFIFFFAYVSFFCKEELLTTGLGKAVLVLILLMYLSRAGEEIVLPGFSVMIFVVCLLISGIYLVPLLASGRRTAG
ncbi:MAG: hypothetical protein GY856_31730 [bacterium]|nr:hypothetical protein [bacterium]